MMDYEKDIRIDDNALDVEWLEQPSLLMRYSKHAAKCRKALDEAKELLDLTKAEIDKKIRKNPERYGIEKITEGAVLACILVNDVYKEAKENFIQASYEVDIAQVAVNAIYQRKDALENLVKLHGMGYFAGPKMPRDLSKEREVRQEKINNAIANKLNKKKQRFV